MNRHLHNTLSALLASGSLLVLGLIAASPLAPPPAASLPGQSLASDIRSIETVASAAVLTAEVTSANGLVSAMGQAAGTALDATPRNKNDQNYRRHALVMPYLSFVPRG